MVKSLSYMFLGGIIALALAFGGYAAFAQTTDDSTATPEAGNAIQDETAPDSSEPGNGRFGGHHGLGGRGGLDLDTEAFLAEALGITTDELQVAKDAAHAAIIEQAVTDGLLTQEQADELLSGESSLRGFGGHGLRLGGTDHDAYLAEALGISVEELDAAQETARTAALQQAVDEGLITQEQVDQMAAAQALKDAIDQDAIIAEILGVTVEEYQAAKEAHTVQDLVDASGLSREELATAVQEAYTAAVQQAVTDGIITQEQADALANGRGLGLGLGMSGGGRGHGGHGGGRGGFGPGDCDASTITPDDNTTPDTSAPADTSDSSNA